MMAYVEEAGNIALCSVHEDYPGCDEKEKGYINKMKAKSTEECQSQLDRLGGMEGDSMKPELKRWLLKRKKILKQLVESSVGSEEL